MAGATSAGVGDVGESSGTSLAQWGAVTNPKLVEMWRKERGCDVTIVCTDNRSLKAHSLVLCSVSDRLDELLNMNANTDKVISSPDVEFSTWNTLLEIIYTGSFDISGAEVDIGSIEVAMLLAETLGMDSVVQLYNSSSIVQLMKESDIVLSSDGNVDTASSATPPTDMLGTVVSIGMSDINMPTELEGVGVETTQVGQIINIENLQGGNQMIVLDTGQENQSNVMEVINYLPDDNTNLVPMSSAGAIKEDVIFDYVPVSEINSYTPVQSTVVLSEPEVQATTSESPVQCKSSALKPPRMKICYNCKHSRCRAEKVRCILCCKVVDNNGSHMDLEHQFTPETSSWVFTCKFFASDDKKNRDWLVCKKGPVKVTNHIGTIVVKIHHHCLLCENINYEILEEMVNHLKTKHVISVRLCKICQSGFCSSLQYKDHEHFCNGGELIKCKHCKKVVGGFHQLNSHMSLHRKDILNEELEDSGNEENFEENDDVEYTDADMARIEKEVDNFKKITVKRMKPRKEVCTKCGNDCKAKKVRCMYCFDVVPRNSSHMKEKHYFTPEDSLWVYNCKHLPTGDADASSVICFREILEGTEELPTYRCLKCQLLFSTSDRIEKHLKQEHNILLRMCTLCGMGLTKEYHYKDHQHFCGGGKILYCKLCFRKVGGVKALKDHMYRVHNKGISELGGSEEQQNMGFTEDDMDDTVSHDQEYSATDNDEITVYGCKPCKEFFSDELQLSEHKRLLHNNREPPVKIKNKKKKERPKPAVYSTRSGRRVSRGNPRYSDYITDIDIKKEEVHSEEEYEKEQEEQEEKESQSNAFLDEDVRDDSDVQQKKCIRCESVECKAEKVKCLYCFSIISNDIGHMSKQHPYLSNNSTWVIDCRIDPTQSEENQKLVMICAKEMINDADVSNAAVLQYEYKCFICGESCSTSEDVQDHVQLEHSIDAKLCILCSAGFRDEKHCIVHEHFCMGRELNGCVKCTSCQNNIDLKAIEDHECIFSETGGEITVDNIRSIKDEESQYFCEKCSIEFESLDHLRKHEQSEHNDEKEEKTSNKKSPSKASRKRRNVTSNIDTSNGVCVECNGQCNVENVRCLYCFKVVDNDVSHKKICHPFTPVDSIWGFTCKLEQRKYQSMLPVIFSKEVYHNKKEETEEEEAHAIKLELHQFKCLRCESKFSTIEELQQHVKVKYRCFKCKLYFVKLSSLVRHVQRNHGYEVTVCKQCECGFVDESCSEEHQHFCMGGGILECRYCGAEFFSVGKLKLHMELEHHKLNDNVSIVASTNKVEADDQSEGNSRPKKKLKLEADDNGDTEKISSSMGFEDLEKVEREDDGALDDEFNDPSYNEGKELKDVQGEEDGGEEVDEEDDDEEEEESDYEPPIVTKKANRGKRGRGRPRKNIEQILERKPKFVALTEEELCEIHKDNYSCVESQREWVHCKVCYTCGDACTAETVKCGYCGMVLSVADKFNHMQDMHPLTPPNSIWPVNCRFFKLNIQIPEVVAKQVVVFEVVKDEEENMIQYSKGQGVYTCNICDSECGNLADTETHLSIEHNIKVLFCNQCGLGIKSSCLNLMSDHQHFCQGGDMLHCLLCGKKVGCWKAADSHYKKYHVTEEVGKKKRTCNKPLYKSETCVTQGSYGYTILCGDCNGTCKHSPVKCSLCHEIVAKDDIHMKLKHPYSVCTTWVVCCRFALHANSNNPSQLPEFLGEKVPTVSQMDLLQEGAIPSNHPFNFRCNHCQMYFMEHKYLRLHIKTSHIDPIEPDHLKQMSSCCRTCDAILYGRSYFFQDHMQFCSKGEMLPCDVCGEKFIGSQKLNIHKKTRHKDMYSARQKAKRNSIRVHNHVVNIPEGTILNCAECSFTTPAVKIMKQHNKNVHGWSGLQLIQFCRFCLKIFKVRSDRERHEQDEHLNGAKSLCEACGESFDIPLQLERHEYYAHRGGREYIAVKQKQDRENATIKICPHCTKEYTSQGKLNRHIKVVHEQTLVFKCNLCHKTFSSNSSLKVHLDRHSGNRSCKCPYCPYTDYQGYMINNHVQIEHPGEEKPFKKKTVFGAVKKEDGETEQEVVYEMSADQEESVIFQVPTQQIEVKQVEMVSQDVEGAVAAGNVLLEYYVVQ